MIDELVGQLGVKLPHSGGNVFVRDKWGVRDPGALQIHLRRPDVTVQNQLWNATAGLDNGRVTGLSAYQIGGESKYMLGNGPFNVVKLNYGIRAQFRQLSAGETDGLNLHIRIGTGAEFNVFWSHPNQKYELYREAAFVLDHAPSASDKVTTTNWPVVDIRGIGSVISVRIRGIVRMTYTDIGTPATNGKPGFRWFQIPTPGTATTKFQFGKIEGYYC